jgi:hypothetical protein
VEEVRVCAVAFNARGVGQEYADIVNPRPFFEEIFVEFEFRVAFVDAQSAFYYLLTMMKQDAAKRCVFRIVFEQQRVYHFFYEMLF